MLALAGVEYAQVVVGFQHIGALLDQGAQAGDGFVRLFLLGLHHALQQLHARFGVGALKLTGNFFARFGQFAGLHQAAHLDLWAWRLGQGFA